MDEILTSSTPESLLESMMLVRAFELNAVAQQQQAYILRNAVTTAAARAILQSSPEEALRFAREVLSSDDVAQTLERLGEVMGGIQARNPAQQG